MTTPIANPLEVDNYKNLYLMWASTGGFGPAEKVYVWAGSFDDAFEEAVEYWDDHAPGVFETVEDPEESDMTFIGHTTLKHGNAIPSQYWGGDDVTRKGEFMDVYKRSARAYYEEYGEVPRGYGRKTAKASRSK